MSFYKGLSGRRAPEGVHWLRSHEVHAGAILAPLIGSTGDPIVTFNPVAVGVVPVDPPNVVGRRTNEANHGLRGEDDLVVVVNLLEVLLFGGPRFTDYKHPSPGAIVVEPPTTWFDEGHLAATTAADGRDVDVIGAWGSSSQ